MPKKMYVTVLNLDTTACQAESISKRKARFENALRDANTFIAGKMTVADNGRKVWNIFAAPEYSFANPLTHGNHEAGDVRHLSEGTKVSIESWLKNLSTQHGRTLIFPGSIAWKKSLARNQETYLKNKEATNPNFDKVAATRHFQSKVLTRQQKGQHAVLNSVNQFQGGDANWPFAGDMQEPEFFEQDPISKDWWFETAHPSGTMRGTRRCTTDYKLAKMKLLHKAPTGQSKADELSTTAKLMARNTSLIYLNGKKQAKYHKAQDYHEVLDSKGDTVYVPGNSVPTFTAEGLVFGVEICLDHAFGTLNARLPVGQLPDVVVLMSAKVQFDASQLPNPAAMVVHACSEESWSFVGRGGVADADCTKESPPSLTDYTIYSFNV